MTTWAVDYVAFGVQLVSPSGRYYPRGTYTILPEGAVYRQDEHSRFIGMLGEVPMPTDMPAFELRLGHQTIVYPTPETP